MTPGADAPQSGAAGTTEAGAEPVSPEVWEALARSRGSIRALALLHLLVPVGILAVPVTIAADGAGAAWWVLALGGLAVASSAVCVLYAFRLLRASHRIPASEDPRTGAQFVAALGAWRDLFVSTAIALGLQIGFGVLAAVVLVAVLSTVIP